MKLHLNCTANLGDFMNSLPVVSGLAKEYGKPDFIIRREMKKFKGLKEFLMYQGIFNSVEFEDDVFMYGSIIPLSSWTREDQNNPNRPIETCRYENWLNDLGLRFEVDDDFTLQVEDNPSYAWNPGYYGGDRWNGPDIDGRRASWTLAHLDNITFLDYNNTLMENAYIIKNCNGPFISTFTGISGVADLLNKEQIVLWGEDIRNWDNKPIEYSFKKHYYGNRKSKLMYLGDFDVSKINEYYPLQG